MWVLLLLNYYNFQSLLNLFKKVHNQHQSIGKMTTKLLTNTESESITSGEI